MALDLKTYCKRERLAAAKQALKWANGTARAIGHRKAYHHIHHAGYVVYYLFALIEHKGMEAVIVGGLLVCSIIATLAGEEE